MIASASDYIVQDVLYAMWKTDGVIVCIWCWWVHVEARYEVLTLTGADVDGFDAQTNDAVYLYIHGTDADCEEAILRRNDSPDM